MGPGGFRGLQNRCDPTTSGRVGSIPTRSRHTWRVVTIAASTSLLASALAGQEPDSARVTPPPAVVVPRTASAPPITPRRAFLYSLAIPGSAQSILDRPGAGALFVGVEVGSLVMLAKSLRDLGVAKAMGDSIVVGFSSDAARTPIRIESPLAPRIRPRRAFVEDWVTLLLVNHFLAGAEAFVSAQLWDMPADVSVSRLPAGGVAVGARIAW